MRIGAQTYWDETISQAEIERRQRVCVKRLGVEIAPHLMHGPVRIQVQEEIRHDSLRTVYTVRATIEPD